MADQNDFVVRDPVWGDIQMSEAYFALSCTAPFMIADRIRQLGPVHLVYPGALHNRRSHSLGVYHVARKLIGALSDRGFIDFTDRRSVRSFFAAALCHDIGHYPYAHSLKELPLARHETLAADAIIAEPLRSAVGACGADPDLVAAIIDPDRGIEDRETRFFRSLLSGVLDPDKIDYLTRDAYFCGVPYGVQDAEYILRHVVVGADDAPGVDAKGVMSVESVLFSKYLMYRSVYWHPAVRSATAMIRKSVSAALSASLISQEELYGIDDWQFTELLSSRGAACMKPALQVFEGSTYPAAIDIPFDPENPAHRDLLDLERRQEAESTLASAAGMPEEDIVVDIPEPISFETDLPVYDERGSRRFAECDTVFTPDVVIRFPQSLRRVRVFVRDPDDRAVRMAESLLS